MPTWMISFALLLSGPDTVVVCPPAVQEAMSAWVARRTAQGHRILIVRPESTPRGTRRLIREVSQQTLVRAVVLVGDARGPIAVPTFVRATPVSHRFGGADRIATDAPYADLNDDGIPDIAVGRFSVRRVEQLRGWQRKIQDFEEQTGGWRTRIELIAGVGGFSPILDKAIDQTVSRLLSTSVPSAYDTRLTQADWRSPFCPDPRTFHIATRRSLNRGSVFWVYMGHGHPFGLDRVTVPGSQFPILTMEQIDQLRYERAPAVALLFACSTGAFYADESFAERLVRHRHGPVSAIAASGVTMPYGMALLGNGMAEAFFQRKHDTLGDVFLSAKRALVDERSLAKHRWVHWMARLLSPNRDALAAERREHVDLFQLLGDPLLRLPHPRPIEIAGPRHARAGESIELTIRTPFSGRGHVELIAEREYHRRRFPRREIFRDAPDELARYDARHAEANNRRWRRVPFVCDQPAGQRVSLAIPQEARGPSHIIVYLEDHAAQFATGQRELEIKEAAKNAAREEPMEQAAGG